jgi:Family of unknown function (DUF5662)
MKPALGHHYAANRHYLEHFANGVNDVTLVDLVEMLADWKAATERSDTGDLRKSLEIEPFPVAGNLQVRSDTPTAAR